LPDRVDAFIESRFPWGKKGFPPAPPEASSQVRRQSVENWIGQVTRAHGSVALGLAATIGSLLDEVRRSILQDEGERFIYRVDSTHLVKSPAGILDKMVRECPEGGIPKYDFQNFLHEMPDIGRFRIVVSFLDDLTTIRRSIENAYGAENQDRTTHESRLREEFELVRGEVEDSVELPVGGRKKGERCIKAGFRLREPRELSHLRVEVQIQTQLQEAWDKKDHYLVYEPRRRGEAVPAEHEREIFAMSEVLYIADLTFSRLRARVLLQRRPRSPNAAS
jgi:ppGpp synthetase/RelA/SpoT-type nucleotidyltranferase